MSPSADPWPFPRRRFEDRTPPRGYGGTGKSSGSGGAGVLIMNPPYGERLPVQEIEALYSSIGDTLKQKYAGYEAFILTGNLKAAKRFGIRSSARTKLYNGALECRLLHFEMYAGSRKPARSGHSGAAHAT
ncbi:MAG: hypothetical protein ACE5GA_06365 [Candidatus Zixiibacteriota bacterium]